MEDSISNLKIDFVLELIPNRRSQSMDSGIAPDFEHSDDSRPKLHRFLSSSTNNKLLYDVSLNSTLIKLNEESSKLASINQNSNPHLSSSYKKESLSNRMRLLSISHDNSSVISTSEKQSWLLRLFESKHFDMSIAIHYLFNSKEPGVQSYIGNKIFSFDDSSVDFFMPQLLTMYIYMHDVAEVLHPYLVNRCRRSFSSSLMIAWLLGAYSTEVLKPNWKNSQGPKLRNMILAEELRPLSKESTSILVKEITPMIETIYLEPKKLSS